MRKYLVAIFSFLSITPAMANDVDLGRGRISREYGCPKQALSLKNNTARPLNEVWAECGFFRGDELVGKGIASFRNVLPGQTAYDEATSASLPHRKSGRVTQSFRPSQPALDGARRYNGMRFPRFGQPMPHFGGGVTVTSIAE